MLIKYFSTNEVLKQQLNLPWGELSKSGIYSGFSVFVDVDLRELEELDAKVASRLHGLLVVRRKRESLTQVGEFIWELSVTHDFEKELPHITTTAHLLHQNILKHTEIMKLTNDLTRSKKELRLMATHYNQVSSNLRKQAEEEIKLKDEQLKESQEELELERAKFIQASKMSALGEMAGGIAHEINNPLAIISGRLSVLYEYADEGELDTPLLKKNLEKIEKTLDRIRKIVVGLRNISRDGSPDSEEIYISKVFDDVLGLCAERFKSHGIDLSVSLDKSVEDHFVMGSHVQLSQVILNLLSNAHDAVEGLSEKWVKVDARKVGGFLFIRVMDSGNGIPEPLRTKIFNPFYTQKPVGKGTGLGLSISKSIVNKHLGTLEIDTQASNTCFVIQLPLVQKTLDLSM